MYSEDLANRVCEAIALSTKGIDSICAENKGFPAGRTVRLWLLTRPEFVPLYARAREAQMELMGAELLEIADDGSNDTYVVDEETGATAVNHDVINRSRLRVDTRKWLMSKLAPKKYGDTLGLTGPAGTGPIQLVSSIPRPPKE